MKKGIFVLIILFSIHFTSKADYFDSTSDGKTLVVHESDKGTLFVVNTSDKTKSLIRLGRNCMDWLKVLQDSLVLVHFKESPFSEIYSIKTGKSVRSFDKFVNADKNEKYLYSIESSETAGQYYISKSEIGNYEQKTKSTNFALPATSTLTRLFCMSADQSKLAVFMNSGSSSKLVIADIAAGKVVKEISGFRSYDLFDSFMNSTGKEEKSPAFLDINDNGSRVVTGNRFVITLYDGSNGKKLGVFKEDPENQREDFSNTFFSPDGKLIYIGSMYKIYTCSINTLAAIEHIIVDGQRTTFNTIDQFGTLIKSKSYFQEDFVWNNVMVSDDNHYIFSICSAGSYGSSSKVPYFWRFNITTDGDPYYFTYK